MGYGNMNKTIKYYDENADKYFNSTICSDMNEYYSKFLSYIEEGNIIVDAGCGSGRDSKYFSNLGFKVLAYDASCEMVKKAIGYTGLDIKCCTFINDGCELESVNAIWACASLLHLHKKTELPLVLRHFYQSLVYSGVLYASFKYGENSFVDENGRYYELINEKDLKIFENEGFEIAEVWISDDKIGRDTKWINIICKK